MNSDKDRSSALVVRNQTMKETLSKENAIPSDRVLEPKTLDSFLPPSLK